jgi:hypothetical protein
MADKTIHHICIVCARWGSVDNDQICWPCKNMIMAKQMKIERLKDELKQQAVDTYGDIIPLKRCFSEYNGMLYFWFNVAESFGETTKIMRTKI